MDVFLLLICLIQVIAQHGLPEILNTDQGSQFLCEEFTSYVNKQQIRISMDGKGRALGNIYVERLWLSVTCWKYNFSYKTQYKADKGLSVIVPIVIYNGEEAWKEEPDFMSYFQLVDEELRQYIPAFRYLLIDIHGLDKEWLASLKSAVGYFFLLDKTNLDDVEAAYKELQWIFKELSLYAGQEVITLLRWYLAGLLNYKGIDKSRYLEYINNSKEDNSMLAQSIQRIEE